MRRSAQESAGEQRRARRAPPIEIHLPLEPQASAPSCARRRHRRRRRPTAQRCGQSLASAPSLSAHLPPTTAWEMCRRCRCPSQSRCGRRCRRRRSPSRGRAPRPLRVGAPCSSSCADKTFTAPVGVLLDVLVHSGAKTFCRRRAHTHKLRWLISPGVARLTVVLVPFWLSILCSNALRTGRPRTRQNRGRLR